MAISRDGSRVVYITLDTTSIQLESFDIDPSGLCFSRTGFPSQDAQAACGTPIAISADGTLVVVGCPTENSYRGKVLVYEITGTSWNIIQTIGGDIAAPEGRFGASVAISGDGKRIVIGAPGKVGISHVGDAYWANTKGFQPYVHIYEESSGSWVKVGGDVTMPQAVAHPSDPGTFLFAFGMSVAISDDGSVIAVRSASKDSKGGTFLHKLDSATDDWRRIGEEIEDLTYGNIDLASVGAADVWDHPLTAVSLSGDGQYVAIGAPWYNYPDWEWYYSGQVRVFKDPNWVDPASVPSPASPASPASPSGSCSSSRGTGGTVTTSGEYTIHTFTSSGTFTVADSALTDLAVDVLVVGGGGAGGWLCRRRRWRGGVLYCCEHDAAIEPIYGHRRRWRREFSSPVRGNGGTSAFGYMERMAATKAW